MADCPECAALREKLRRTEAEWARCRANLQAAHMRIDELRVQLVAMTPEPSLDPEESNPAQRFVCRPSE